MTSHQQRAADDDAPPKWLEQYTPSDVLPSNAPRGAAGAYMPPIWSKHNPTPGESSLQWTREQPLS